MSNTDKTSKIIYFIVFFLYSGYYSGLALILSLGLKDLSRFYSIPLRLLLVVLMLIVIKENIWKLARLKKGYLLAIVSFTILYILKVIYTEIISFDGELSRHWIEYIFYFLSYSFLPFLTFSLIDFKKYFDAIQNSLIFSGFTLGILSLYLYKNILAMGLGRISAIKYENPDMETLSPLALSYAAAITIVLILYKLTYTPNNKKIKPRAYFYLIITLALSLVMFYLGASRGSLIALILGSISILMYSRKRSLIKSITYLSIAIPALIYGAMISGSAIFTRTTASIEKGDTSGREILWENAIQEFFSYPLIGGRIEILGIYPHNIFLEILMATGIVGFLLFIYVFFSLSVRVHQMCRIEKEYLIPLLVLIVGFSQYMFSGAVYISILFFLPLGIIYSSYLKSGHSSYSKNEYL